MFLQQTVLVPFLGNLLNVRRIQTNSIHHRKKELKIQYLPHHQPSHDEGVEDSKETINRCWVKTRQNEKEEEKVTVDRWKNLAKYFIIQNSLGETVYISQQPLRVVKAD